MYPSRPLSEEDLPTEPCQQRSLEKRARLKAAALRLFGEHGYENTSIEDIARRANLASGGFYLHFRSKRQLLLVLMDDLVDVLSRLELRLRSSKDVRTELRALLARAFANDLQYLGAVRAWQEAVLTDPDLAQKYSRLRRQGPSSSSRSKETRDTPSSGQPSRHWRKSRRLQGFVVDGSMRGVADFQRLGLPMYARGTVSGSAGGHYRLEAVDVPVMCGGVEISPGDFVIGDADGVAVAPRHVYEDVVAGATRLRDEKEALLPLIAKRRSYTEAVKERQMAREATNPKRRQRH